MNKKTIGILAAAGIAGAGALFILAPKAASRSKPAKKALTQTKAPQTDAGIVIDPTLKLDAAAGESDILLDGTLPDLWALAPTNQPLVPQKGSSIQPKTAITAPALTTHQTVRPTQPGIGEGILEKPSIKGIKCGLQTFIEPTGEAFKDCINRKTRMHFRKYGKKYKKDAKQKKSGMCGRKGKKCTNHLPPKKGRMQLLTKGEYYEAQTKKGNTIPTPPVTIYAM